MTDAFAALALDLRAVLTGWTLFVILWETTIIGVCLAAWRTWLGRAPAREQHAAAVFAFALALALAAVTPMALERWARWLPPAAASGASFDPPPGRAAAVPLPAFRGETASTVDAIASAAALIWALGVVVLTIRL